MSRRSTTPANAVKLSNVVVVRKKGLEVACYPDKVDDFRRGVERDVDEVLQVRQVFKNVSKGVLASKKDVETALLGASSSNTKGGGTTSSKKQQSHVSMDEACILILREGEVQVSERERQTKLEALFRDIAVVVAEKTRDAATGRPFPATAVEKVMRDALHFAPTASRSAKQQALEVIKRLEARHDLGFVRAKMRLQLVGGGTAESSAALVAAATAALEEVDGVGAVDERDRTVLAEPRSYRDAVAAVRDATGGRLALEVRDHAAGPAGGGPARGGELHPGNNGSGDDEAHPREAAVVRDDDDDDVVTREDPPQMPAKPQRVSKAAKRREKEAAIERAEARRVAEERRQERARARRDPPEPALPANGEPSSLPPPPPKRLTCNTCGGTFADAAAHREHFRSDWHRTNLKLKLENKPPMSEDDFAQRDLLAA